MTATGLADRLQVLLCVGEAVCRLVVGFHLSVARPLICCSAELGDESPTLETESAR